MKDIQADFQQFAAEVVAVQRASRTPAAFQLNALKKKVAGLESRLGTAPTVYGDGLAALGAQLAELEAKLRTLESLPADVEGVYAALYRVADEVKTARRDEALA